MKPRSLSNTSGKFCARIPHAQATVSIATATRALRNIIGVSKTILKNTGNAHLATLAEQPNAIDHPSRSFDCPRGKFWTCGRSKL